MKNLKDKIKEYEQILEKMREISKSKHGVQNEEMDAMVEELEGLREELYQNLTPWDRIQICRNPKRPRSIDYIEKITDSFTELHGDRLYGDDPALIGGLGYIGGKRFIIIAQEKGNDTESRVKRNFGMCHPEGYRKALRLMEMAEKFSIPVVCLIDTPGAYCGLAAEERGQGAAIATNLLRMMQLKTPIICTLIGEGASGGALGIGIGDVFGMLEHAYYSVISPEGCAMILFKDTKQFEKVTEVLKVQVEHLIKAGVVDVVIHEPPGGAHLDPSVVYQGVKDFILSQEEYLSTMPYAELLERRYNKFRKLGVVDEISPLIDSDMLTSYHN